MGAVYRNNAAGGAVLRVNRRAYPLLFFSRESVSKKHIIHLHDELLRLLQLAQSMEERSVPAEQLEADLRFEHTPDATVLAGFETSLSARRHSRDTSPHLLDQLRFLHSRSAHSRLLHMKSVNIPKPLIKPIQMRRSDELL